MRTFDESNPRCDMKQHSVFPLATPLVALLDFYGEKNLLVCGKFVLHNDVVRSIAIFNLINEGYEHRIS